MKNNEKGGMKLIVSAIACLIVLAMGFLGNNGNNADNNATNVTTSQIDYADGYEKIDDRPDATLPVENPVASNTTVFGETTTSAETITSATEETTTAAIVKEPFYFRTKQQWESHYEKHGIEMGFASAQEYLDAANRVIINPEALTKTEKEDGDFIYYVESTNEFVVISTDGFIRTYFNPSAGIDYFNRQ